MASRSRQRSRAVSVVALAAVAIGGCQARTLETLDGVTMLRYEALEGPADGFIAGTIAFRDGCIWIDHAGGSSIVLWPRDAALDDGLGRVVVLLGGRQGAAFGDESSASFSGRAYSEPLPFIRELLGDPCVTASYWMATEGGVLIVN